MARQRFVVVLDLDGQPEIGTFRFHQIQQLMQFRDAGPRELGSFFDTEIQLFQFVQSHFCDRARAVAAQIDVGFVRYDDLVVRSQSQIEFDAVHRQFKRLFKSDQSVFRITAGPAAVCDDLRFHDQFPSS